MSNKFVSTGQFGVCVLLALLCAGCQNPATKKQLAMERFTIQHDNLVREYYLFSPKNSDHQTPLLIFLHGYGGTATGTEAETTNGLNRYASEYGYAVIYPQGTWFKASSTSAIVTSWNDLGGNQDRGPKGPLCSENAPKYPCPPECGDCGQCGWTSCHDDLGFLTRLINEGLEKHNLGHSGVFVSGFSNGSMMAQRLACHATQKLSAVALVGGRLEKGMDCSPDTSIPLLQINGGKDSVVPYQGELPDSDFFYTSTQEVDREWAAANACAQQPKPWLPKAVVPTSLECSVRCDSQSNEVINCLWPEGAHVWPGYAANQGNGGYCVTKEQLEFMPDQTICFETNTKTDVWGSRLVFDFFQRHRK